MHISFTELKRFSPSGQEKIVKLKGKLLDSIFVSPNIVCSLYKFFENYIILYRSIQNNHVPQVELTSYHNSVSLFSKIREFPERPIPQ